MDKTKNKDKEERFEKVVEWEDSDNFEWGMFFILMIPALFGLWLGVSLKDLDLISGISYLYSIFFIIGIIIYVQTRRKVYWRKVNE